jgi:hypothetical protein
MTKRFYRLRGRSVAELTTYELLAEMMCAFQDGVVQGEGKDAMEVLDHVLIELSARIDRKAGVSVNECS